MIRKTSQIILEAIPVLFMIALISFVGNDYLLTFCFIIVIAISLSVRKLEGDWLYLTFGFVAMTFFEWLFVSTGVETFASRSFLGVMPLWLPVLWAYGFLAIGRAGRVIAK